MIRSKNLQPLQVGISNTGGRTRGQITIPRRKALQKRQLRFIDFKRVICPRYRAKIIKTFYDPIRTSNIALLCFPFGVLCYILLPAKVKIGDLVRNRIDTPIYSGDSSEIKSFPAGMLVHNLSLAPSSIGQLIRSAGCSAILVRHEPELHEALFKLKSGELRYLDSSNTASLGTLGNNAHHLRHWRKAGTTRHFGKRGRTRPSAMNPVDHPMGGRTRGGFQPCNSKGLITTHLSTKKYRHISIIRTKRHLKFQKMNR
jgi:large subunit ribosomal protein L2